MTNLDEPMDPNGPNDEARLLTHYFNLSPPPQATGSPSQTGASAFDGDMSDSFGGAESYYDGSSNSYSYSYTDFNEASQSLPHASVVDQSFASVPLEAQKRIEVDTAFADGMSTGYQLGLDEGYERAMRQLGVNPDATHQFPTRVEQPEAQLEAVTGNANDDQSMLSVGGDQSVLSIGGDTTFKTTSQAPQLQISVTELLDQVAAPRQAGAQATQLEDNPVFSQSSDTHSASEGGVQRRKRHRGRPANHATIIAAGKGTTGSPSLATSSKSKSTRVGIPESAELKVKQFADECFETAIHLIAVKDYWGTTDYKRILQVTREYLANQGIILTDDDITPALESSLCSALHTGRHNSRNSVRKKGLERVWPMSKVPHPPTGQLTYTDEEVKTADWLIEDLHYAHDTPLPDFSQPQQVADTTQTATDVQVDNDTVHGTFLDRATAKLPETGRFTNPVVGNIIWAMASHQSVYYRNMEIFKRVETFPLNIVIFGFLTAYNFLEGVQKKTGIAVRFQRHGMYELIHEWFVAAINAIMNDEVHGPPFKAWLKAIIAALGQGKPPFSQS
ncbi:hypothetical protein MIND_01143300 [Mycena indigotica]|uniref:Uncharacterized protein n=1 Tax=Mycena indigotica TaxID=2126181 RepID=A0A8H6VTS4_9AGAR|nr:uncharacterized protein MIND_01143300 [Mycena indigotica]KAF7293639.1 hypothetical protein MIND_01143300 [Mycena indigotica]